MKLINWLIETFSMPWFYNTLGTRSKTHDKILIYIMENNILPEVSDGSSITATFNGIEIWLRNYPYAFGREWDAHGSSEYILPTIRIAYRFKQYSEMVMSEHTLMRIKGLSK